MCEAYTTALEMHVLKKAAVYYDFITERLSANFMIMWF